MDNARVPEHENTINITKEAPDDQDSRTHSTADRLLPLEGDRVRYGAEVLRISSEQTGRCNDRVGRQPDFVEAGLLRLHYNRRDTRDERVCLVHAGTSERIIENVPVQNHINVRDG